MRSETTGNKIARIAIGTLEGLTNQLMHNQGEMLHVANEAESFFNKLYSVKVF